MQGKLSVSCACSTWLSCFCHVHLCAVVCSPVSSASLSTGLPAHCGHEPKGSACSHLETRHGNTNCAP